MSTNMYSVSYSIVEVSRIYEVARDIVVLADNHPGLLDESSDSLLDENGYPIEDENGD